MADHVHQGRAANNCAIGAHKAHTAYAEDGYRLAGLEAGERQPRPTCREDAGEGEPFLVVWAVGDPSEGSVRLGGADELGCKMPDLKDRRWKRGDVL